jgi:acyl-CoA thioesterase-1
MRILLSAFCVLALACGSPDYDSGPAAQDTPAPTPGEAPAPPPDEPVVVFMGTSLTAGLGLLREEDTYVAQLAELARERGLPMRAVNAGVSGETSAGGLRRIEWVLRDSLDILFLELGANDGLRGQDPDATRSNLEQIVETTRRRYPEARILIAAMEAPPNLGDRYTRDFREVFPEVATSADAALVPFILEGIAGVPSLNQSDGIHPTAEGHRRMAENIWTVLGPTLEAWYEAREGTRP